MRVKVDKKEVRRKLRAGQFSEGCFCKFVLVGDGSIAVKVYRTWNEMWKAHHMQKMAHEAGLAPKVYQRFKLSPRRYCYVTQVVPLRPNASEPALARLAQRLEDVGLVHYDLHSDNVGMVGRNLVCIDFDSRGCYKVSEAYKRYEFLAV